MQFGGGGGGDFRVSRHAKIRQFDRFSSEINFKRARSCNYGIPRLDSSLKIYCKGSNNESNQTIPCFEHASSSYLSARLCFLEFECE